MPSLLFQSSSDPTASLRDRIQKLHALIQHATKATNKEIHMLFFEITILLEQISQRTSQDIESILRGANVSPQTYTNLKEILMTENKTNEQYICELRGAGFVQLQASILEPITISRGQITTSESHEIKQQYNKISLMFASLQEAGIQTNSLICYGGYLHNTQRRKSSYLIIPIPSHKKTIFVCNQQQEATYIVHEIIDLAHITQKTKIDLMTSHRSSVIDFRANKISLRTNNINKEITKTKVIPKTLFLGQHIIVDHNDASFAITLPNEYKPTNVVRIATSGIRAEYVIDSDNARQKFLERVENNAISEKDGYYPSLCFRSNGQAIPLASQQLFERFVKQHQLIKKSEDTRITLSGKDIYFTDPITKQKMIRISSAAGIFGDYIGSEHQLRSSFVSRAQGKQGYFPNTYKPPHGKGFIACTEELFSEFIFQNNIRKKEEDARTIMPNGVNEIILIVQGKRTTCYRLSDRGILGQYHGDGEQKVRDFKLWSTAQNHQGYFQDICKSSAGASVPVCTKEYFETYLNYRQSINKPLKPKHTLS
ncbi:MAG: hypothetical protein WC004_00740 [Candidatus Absconditabacterales bacterium]